MNSYFSQFWVFIICSVFNQIAHCMWGDWHSEKSNRVKGRDIGYPEKKHDIGYIQFWSDDQRQLCLIPINIETNSIQPIVATLTPVSATKTRNASIKALSSFIFLIAVKLHPFQHKKKRFNWFYSCMFLYFFSFFVSVFRALNQEGLNFGENSHHMVEKVASFYIVDLKWHRN